MPTYLLTDLNGEEWTFDRSGPLGLRYVRGIDGAAYEFDTTHGVDQAGVTVNATDLKSGSIELGVYVQPGFEGQPAVDVLSSFVDGLGRGLPRNDRLPRFTVDDTGRFQEVRLQERFQVDWEKMRYAGYNFIELKLMSDESWWRKPPFRKVFTPDEFASATVSNMGDVDAWWWAKLTGPITSPTLGVGGEAITIGDIADGDYRIIETDPNWWEISDSAGVDQSWIGERWHAKVPARTSTQPFTITGTGTTAATSLEIVVPQMFERAL